MYRRAGRSASGITYNATSHFSVMFFNELPAAGTVVKAGAKFGAIESVKAASDLYAPVSGTVSQVNDALSAQPELVNREPYSGGWMIRLDGVSEGGVELLDEAAYEASTAG